MPHQKLRLRTICLVFLFMFGLGFGTFSIFLYQLLPYVQLDAVLTQAELVDDEKRIATLAILKKASGNLGLFWLAMGVVVSVVSAIGLCPNDSSGEDPRPSDN